MKADVIKEIWEYKDIIDFSVMMGWSELIADIEALEQAPEKIFTDKLKYGDVRITLYRKENESTIDTEDCPFYFTAACK